MLVLNSIDIFSRDSLWKITIFSMHIKLNGPFTIANGHQKVDEVVTTALNRFRPA